MSSGAKKDTNQLLRKAAGLGAIVEVTTANHYKISNPVTGQSTQIGRTPGSSAQVRCSRARLRKIGLAV